MPGPLISNVISVPSGKTASGCPSMMILALAVVIGNHPLDAVEVEGPIGIAEVVDHDTAFIGVQHPPISQANPHVADLWRCDLVARLFVHVIRPDEEYQIARLGVLQRYLLTFFPLPSCPFGQLYPVLAVAPLDEAGAVEAPQWRLTAPDIGPTQELARRIDDGLGLGEPQTFGRLLRRPMSLICSKRLLPSSQSLANSPSFGCGNHGALMPHRWRRKSASGSPPVSTHCL